MQPIECWNTYTQILTDVLAGLDATDARGISLGYTEAFQRWEHATATLQRDRAVYLIGNGASASMASHFAADLAKNAHIPTHVFTDSSLITAIGNDIGYDECFAEPLRWYLKSGSMLVAISSSGNSPNIVKACLTARKQGAYIVTLSAMAADNAIRSLGDINFYIAAPSYSLAESGHASMLHYWIDRVVAIEERNNAF